MLRVFEFSVLESLFSSLCVPVGDFSRQLISMWRKAALHGWWPMRTSQSSLYQVSHTAAVILLLMMLGYNHLKKKKKKSVSVLFNPMFKFFNLTFSMSLKLNCTNGMFMSLTFKDLGQLLKAHLYIPLLTVFKWFLELP